MKKVLLCLSAALLVCACSKFDDSKILSRLDTLETAILDIQKVMGSGDYITSIEEVKDDAGTVTGYKVTFKSNGSFTVYNGQQGPQGPQGPEGPAGSGGDSFFTGVEVHDDYVVFTTDDGSFIVPRNASFVLAFESKTIEISAQELEIPYTVTNASKATEVGCIAEGAYSAEVVPTDYKSGIVKVSVPENGSEGKVIVFADNGDGKTSIKTLSFIKPETLVFEDDFSWAQGTCGNETTTGGEVTWAKTEDTNGWTSEKANGNDNIWCRKGCVRMSRTGWGGCLVSPKFTKLTAATDVTVSFKAGRWFNGSSLDALNILSVVVVGGGYIGTEGTTSIVFHPEAYAASSDDVWQNKENVTFNFDITGATSETQIKFISSDNIDTFAIDVGGATINRIVLDDVKIEKK